MKLLVLSFVALLLVAVISAESNATWISGTPIVSRNSRAIFVDKISACWQNGNKVVCNSDGSPNSCDANMVYRCGTSANTGPDVVCGGSYPYCVANSDGDNARCASSPDPSCPAAAVKFGCTGVGIYPDPQDCHKFYNCYQTSVGGVTTIAAQGFSCPNLYVFDPSGPQNPDYCRLTYNAYCTTAGCGANDIKNVALNYVYFLPANGQYVATCQGALTPFVTFCPPNYDVDMSTLPPTCRATCSNPYGKNPVIGRTDQYYICVWNGIAYIPMVQPCPTPKVFSTNANECV